MEDVKLTPFTIISFSAIIVVAIIFAIIIWRNRKKLGKQKNLIEQFPSIVSTLGVLGTFLGITIGLWNFETTDIVGSIPNLLNGLRTAFWTSLAGMCGSLGLTWLLNHYIDKDQEIVSDAMEAANIVVKSVKSIEETYKATVNNQNHIYANMNGYLKAIDAKMEMLDGKVNSMNVHISSMEMSVSKVDSKMSSIDTKMVGMSQNVVDLEITGRKMESRMETILNHINKVGEKIEAVNVSVNNFNTMVGASYGRMEKRLSEYYQMIKDGLLSIDKQVEELEGLLPDAVKNIQKSMVETNTLLELKFDEFSQLLKDSNTKSLVEVMKKVSEEFNKEMKELINKLVQENFEQLNKSVERLNTWQVQNKEMIAELTNRYQQMNESFGKTSNTLQVVGNETKSLVDNEGKLSKLVNALNRVMIEDEKFVQITKNLSSTAELTKETTVKFNDEVSALNEWVRKQRDFVKSVESLMVKLEEISRINDYSDKFWKETKEGMNDAIKIIKGATQLLSTNLDDIDERFYDRLNATLSNLDACITAVIKKQIR